MHQHLQPVDATVPPPLAPTQPCGGTRGVDQVVKGGLIRKSVPEIRTEGHGGGVTVQGHAHRRGVHHQICCGQQVSHGGVRFEAAAQGGALQLQVSDEGQQRFRASSDHLDRRQSKGLQASHHGPGGATATEHHSPLVLPVFAAAEGRQKPFHIGVRAPPAILVVGDECVHRLKPTGRLAELAAEAGHSLLVGDGHIEAAAAHRPEPLQHFRQGLPLTGQSQVAPVEPQRLQRCVLHRRGERVLHRVAEQPHQASAAVDHGLVGMPAQPACSGTTPRLGQGLLMKMTKFRSSLQEVATDGQGCRH